MNRQYLSGGAAFVIPALVLFACHQTGVEPRFAKYAAITAWGVYCLVSGYITTMMVAVVLPVLYLIFGVADAKTVFSPWTTSVPWLCFGGLLIGRMLLKCGLTTRLSYKFMSLAGDNFLLMLLGIMAAGFVIGPFIPTTLGKATIFFILGNSICDTLKIPAYSKDSVVIMITCLFATTGPSYATLTSAAHIPVAIQLMEGAAGIKVTWGDFTWHNFLPSVVYSAVSFLTILLLRPTRIQGLSALVREQHARLGPMTADEKKSLLLILSTIGLFVTEPWHGIGASSSIVLIAFLAFCPGVALLDGKDIDKIGFSILYFLAGAMSVGAVAAHIGVADEIAAAAAAFLREQPPVVYIAGSFFLGVLSLLFLSPTTGIATMSAPLTATALQAGLDPRPLIYSFCYGMDMYFFPYQYTLTMLLYSYKRLSGRQLFMALFAKMLLSAALLLPFCLFYWRMLGLW